MNAMFEDDYDLREEQIETFLSNLEARLLIATVWPLDEGLDVEVGKLLEAFQDAAENHPEMLTIFLRNPRLSVVLEAALEWERTHTVS